MNGATNDFCWDLLTVLACFVLPSQHGQLIQVKGGDKR
jgi:hypothetical protein